MVLYVFLFAALNKIVAPTFTTLLFLSCNASLRMRYMNLRHCSSVRGTKVFYSGSRRSTATAVVLTLLTVRILYELAHRMRPVVVALLVIAGTGGRAAAGRRWNRGAAARGQVISTQLTKELMIQLGVGSGSLGLGGTWDLKNHHLLLIVSSAYACDQDPPRDTILPFQCGTWDEIALIRSQALLDCQSLRLIVGPPCCRLSKAFSNGTPYPSPHPK